MEEVSVQFGDAMESEGLCSSIPVEGITGDSECVEH